MRQIAANLNFSERRGKAQHYSVHKSDPEADSNRSRGSYGVRSPEDLVVRAMRRFGAA
jgi:hypothetical protein